ncbi:Hypothetical protein SRAE_0000058600 [Strongyloides ratti]|uniref:Uncharacterized protein n=1 Tax=Strongyloides ratti TaxID=34506 RepID=A0A090L002_STRRB|nr:Hypothetical protein SRAE_0000058600 [Strongyloides ratti]CEF61462.1 Hypothetical protein SRAE_0000058600 [Strongyloides ratti]
MFLSSLGARYRCRGFFNRMPPCNLFINVERDQFFMRTNGLISAYVKRNLYAMKSNYRQRNSVRFRMNNYAHDAFDQNTARKICAVYRVAYKLPTYIRFY